MPTAITTTIRIIIITIIMSRPIGTPVGTNVSLLERHACSGKRNKRSSDELYCVVIGSCVSFPW
jgi:hypothetical protein